MPHYVVVSPEFMTHYQTETEPSEYGTSIAAVANAANASEAKWAAARLWDKIEGTMSYPSQQRRDGEHPLTGVAVIKADKIPLNNSDHPPEYWGNWGKYYVDLKNGEEDMPSRDWFIYDAFEGAYWSNEDGWVDFASATFFTDQERDTMRLPMGTNVEWVLTKKVEQES